jgi:hypothetical protein
VSRRPLVVVFLCLASAALPASVPGQSSPLSVTRTEPLDGSRIAVERVAASSAAADQRWRLNLDIGVANSGRRPYRLVEAEVCYPNAPVFCQEKTPNPAPVVPAGGSIWIQAPEDRDHPFPVAPAVRVVLKFRAEGAQGEAALIVNKSLTEWRNEVPGGGYLFPGKRTDLGDDLYWTDGQNHVYGSNHRNSDSQRFAYDLVVRRWDGKEWVKEKPGKTGKANSDALVWDMPVYAMADGWVLRCNRTIDENPRPGVKGSGGGNSYRIVHRDGEVMLYAHFKKNSIPADLCPREGVDFSERSAPKVKAGQFIGRVGNSGQSSGPHLHIHLGTTGQKGEQGVPILLRNVRTRYAGESWDKSKPCDPKNPSFAATSPPAAVSRRQLIEPYYPAGASELARHGLPEPCFQDAIGHIAASGYQPSWFDGYDVGGKAFVNVVARPGGGEWVMRHNLSNSAYQSEITSWNDKGFKPTLVESYRVGDSLRYAFVAAKRSSPGIGAYHGRSAADHTKLANDFKGKGFGPVSVAVVSLKGKVYYTALWEKTGGSGWLLSSTLDAGEYQRWLETNAKAGRRLTYVNAYHHDGEAYFSAVVRSGVSANYAARRDLTTAGYQAEYNKWTGQGLRTQAVTGYRSGSSHRFAGLWR